MKTKKSKIKSLLGRMLAVVGIVCVLLSCFLVPASADHIANSDSVYVDPWFSNGYLEYYPLGNLSNHTVVGLPGVFYNISSSYYSFDDYFRTTGYSATTNVGFRHYVDKSQRLHVMSFADNIANNIFASGFSLSLGEFLIDYNSLTSWNVGSISFVLNGGLISSLNYTITYECPQYVYDDSVASLIYETRTFEWSGSPVSDDSKYNIFLLPDFPFIDFPLDDSGFVHFPSYFDLPTGEFVYERYALIKDITIDIEFTSGSQLSSFSFNSVFFPEFAFLTSDISTYYESLPLEKRTVIVDNTADIDLSSWLVDAVGGFLDFEIFPGFSISSVLAVLLSLSVVVLFLKWFAGG